MRKSRQAKQTGSTLFHGWKLGEAKAKFSDVVRLAASGQPQHVTVRGRRRSSSLRRQSSNAFVRGGHRPACMICLSQSP